MSLVAFDAAIFRAQCPAYADQNLYPTSYIEDVWAMATAFVSDDDYGYLMGAGRRMAINYMAAHIIYLNNLILQGTTPGTVTASTVDKTNVTLQPPKELNEWQHWLNQSPYGQALLALLKANSAGGLMAGFTGYPRGGIRQPDGGFMC